MEPLSKPIGGVVSKRPPARAWSCGDFPVRRSRRVPSAAKPDTADTAVTSSLQTVVSIFGFVAYWAIHGRVRGGVKEGLESVAMEATRNLNYANKAHGKSSGRVGSAKCDLFDEDGKQKCGRCLRAYTKDEAIQKTEGLHALTCVDATCNVDGFETDVHGEPNL
ncbi:hypothetical protein THAOC_30051, partial [Thalassiosira oceanica]